MAEQRARWAPGGALRGPRRLVSAFAAASPRLTASALALGVLSGALLPVFMLASGALVGAVGGRRSAVVPAALVVAVFMAERVMDPMRAEVGRALWRQVDQHLTQQLMRAMSEPAGLAHVEDPVIRDKVIQAQGGLTDMTPGQAAYYLPQVVYTWVQGLGSLVIVAAFRWWLPALLAAGYLLTFRISERHWHQVTVVLYGRTEALRRSYYLRTVALGPAPAKEVRIFGLADWLVQRYRQGWLAVMHDIWRTRREGWGRAAWATVALGSAELLAVWTVVHAGVVGHLSLARAVATVQAVLAAAVLSQYQDPHWLLSECGRALDRLDEVEEATADHRPDETASADPRPGQAVGWRPVVGGRAPASGLPARAIRFEQVGFVYPGRTERVFDHLDLEVPAGRSLAIVGENGAGKTTLVKLLCRLYDPDEGRITVDGVDLRDLRPDGPDGWHRRVAAIFQDFVQYEVSAYDNVAFGALHAANDAAAVADAISLAGADQIVSRLGAGWDTPLSRQFSSGTQLSGGEWQRLALARALFAVRAGGAGVLILDEPTAALDVRGEAEVYERFLELTQGATTIVISHRFSTVRRAQHIVVLDGGRVVEAGSHDQLLAAGGRYAVMYRLQAERFGVGGHA
ncbi:MAG TPA: ATP-binding cassette domain-containing protein [Acidimicrobiales bacterium]|nr:ATP-binding cassette domain-containing protein [Acidimicrobiales bacterium]